MIRNTTIIIEDGPLNHQAGFIKIDDELITSRMIQEAIMPKLKDEIEIDGVRYIRADSTEKQGAEVRVMSVQPKYFETGFDCLGLELVTTTCMQGCPHKPDIKLRPGMKLRIIIEKA